MLNTSLDKFEKEIEKVTLEAAKYKSFLSYQNETISEMHTLQDRKSSNEKNWSIKVLDVSLHSRNMCSTPGLMKTLQDNNTTDIYLDSREDESREKSYVRRPANGGSATAHNLSYTIGDSLKPVKTKFSVNFPGRLVDERQNSWRNASIDYLISNQSLMWTMDDKSKFSPWNINEDLHTTSQYESNDLGTKENMKWEKN
jgi:hypothetical protein